MATAEHKHPNYMAIFWYLAILTVVEIGVIYLPIGKFTIGVMLCALALGKAALVAMYFMHLKFETRTLGMVAVTPLVIATLGFTFLGESLRDALDPKLKTRRSP